MTTVRHLETGEIATRWATRCSEAASISPASGRYVIVAPHPDDESLTVGGLVSQLRRRGSDVWVISVTHGGNAYPHHYDHDRLVDIRQAEQQAGLDRLGVEPEQVIELGVRDGSVADAEAEIIEALEVLCDEATTIVAPWIHDVHPDHEAVGRACRAAATARRCQLWYSLFWTWHHHDVSILDGARLVKVELNAEDRDRKALALLCHRSQIESSYVEPVLTERVLEPARWDHEFFIIHSGRSE